MRDPHGSERTRPHWQIILGSFRRIEEPHLLSQPAKGVQDRPNTFVVVPDLSKPLGATKCLASRTAAGPQAHRVGAWASSKSPEPTSAMAVNEPGLGSSAEDKGEEGIDRSFERTATPLYLGE
jgi:hypothetical protein